jgi:hypothetical protein
MKNFVVACAFALCTFAFANVANAQCCGGKKSANASCDKPKTEVNANDNTKPDAKTVGTTDKKDKKCCSSDKANASNTKKENCCSKKDARKEETK